MNFTEERTKTGLAPIRRAAGNRRVLIVDDSRAIHEDFRKILARNTAPTALDHTEAALFGAKPVEHEDNTFTLDSAYQGGEALALVKNAVAEKRRYAVAFVDVRMPPGWDGIETTAKLWECDPDLQIVICTAYSDYSWEEMRTRIGHSDRLVILKKPFDTVEVLQLANALSEKWNLLQETRRKMGDLETLVAERTAHLESTNQKLEAEIAQRVRRERCLTLQHDVTRVLADSIATSEDSTTRVLQTICEQMQWDLGALWVMDPHSSVLRVTKLWNVPGKKFSEFKTLTQQMACKRGTGLPGRVWETGEALWIADLASEEKFHRTVALRESGLRSGFAFPIRLQKELLGVIEFFSAEIKQPEQDIHDLFTVLGNLIGQALEQKKLEDQLRHSQKMDAIGHLAGGVAHDFNNILTVILGYAQIVGTKENLDESALEGLRQITHAAQRASSLTGQLMAFSRKQVMQIQELNLNKSIATLAKMLQRVIGEDITLVFDYCSGVALVRADEDSLGQVLMNLTINARDAMPKGGTLEINTHPVTITAADLSRHAEARVGEFICLSVSDTGCGIPPEYLPRIFEPFFTTKHLGEGTGLGLATVHGIVSQHQGWIEVISQVDAGTIFKIYLPRVIGAVPPSAVENSPAPLPGGDETILLVEDEVAVRNLARRVLAKHGYKVLEAGTGKEALLVWEQHQSEIDLLLTDVVMPEGMTGRELAHKLRAERPRLNVVFTSGYDPDKVGMEAELGGEINFLPKPYSPVKLLQAVRQNLDFEVAAT